MKTFNEDTRVKIPATIQFLRLGYKYLSLNDYNPDSDTRIDRTLFREALIRLNGRDFSFEETNEVIGDIHTLLKYNDMGKAFYEWLAMPQAKTKLIDFDNIDNNTFHVVDELTFGPQALGSFRPDVTVLVNGIPLAFLEVKKPNNPKGIQAEFRRMLNERLLVPEYRKYFNMLQIVTFSNNMEYENDSDNVAPEDIRAGSFYTTPNGQQTKFSFFREEQPRKDFLDISPDYIRYVLKDNEYSPTEYDAPEFQTNLAVNTPCNRFVTSLFDKERFLFLLHYGIIYLSGEKKEKHIMRYPQFFASRAILKNLETDKKRGIIFHTQGSGKTELSLYSIRILRDWYMKKNILTRFFYIVDRLSLLTQAELEATSRNIKTVTVSSRELFAKELSKPMTIENGKGNEWGDITVVNIQKFMDSMPETNNPYGAKVQRVFFVDEAHRSYSLKGEFFKNLMLVDKEAVFIAMTGTPLLSKKERSNLKFGDYIHTYFYDRSIADHYTLRIKREKIDTKARTEIKNNLNIPEEDMAKKAVMESQDYINAIGAYINKDFANFRAVNSDDSIGGMIVCCSNLQAKKMKKWFDENSKLETGLVITDPDILDAANRNTQISFKKTLKPDVLIVHQMLTTGYDVDRLKKMYLLRNAKDHTLLQTISRVNRPYRNANGKNYVYGYITDFVDISKEYDRTIENYIKEIEDEYSTEDGGFDIDGLIIGPEEIKKKYDAYMEKLDEYNINMGNAEKFSKQLTHYNREAVLNIRRFLNGIKDCHTEFMLSSAEDYAKEIDIAQIKRLIKETQNRIDFLNLKNQPSTFLELLSNKDVCNIIYEFFLVREETLKFPDITDKFEGHKNEPKFVKLLDLLGKIQTEVKRNQNHTQKGYISLDEMLKEVFEKLNICEWDEIDGINDDLVKIVEGMKDINDENEKLAKRFDGEYSFVKTYSDICETYPDFLEDDAGKLMDMIYGNTKVMKETGLLPLQTRDTFIQASKKNLSKDLLKAGLYNKMNLGENLNRILSDTYKNIRIF